MPNVLTTDIAAKSGDLLVLRIDGVDWASEAVLEEQPERHPTDARRILRGAEDGDGVRVDQGFEAVSSHEPFPFAMAAA